MDIQAFLEYFRRTDALSREMGISVRSLSAEGAEAEMEISDNEKNYMGMLHGGAFFTIADVVAGLCVSYYGEQCVTLSSNLNYLKAAFAGKIIARSSLSRRDDRGGVISPNPPYIPFCCQLLIFAKVWNLKRIKNQQQKGIQKGFTERK